MGSSAFCIYSISVSDLIDCRHGAKLQCGRMVVVRSAHWQNAKSCQGWLPRREDGQRPRDGQSLASAGDVIRTGCSVVWGWATMLLFI